ncbi:AAA family ATPase [Helicobacter sp. 23-1044]
MRTNQVQKIISDEQLYLKSKAKIYMLKFLVELDGFTRFMSYMARQPYDYDEISDFMGFRKICPLHETYAKSKNKEKYKNEILAFCKVELDSLLKKEKQGKIGFHKTLNDNLHILADTLHLNDAEFALVNITAIATEVREFRDFLEAFGNVGRRESALIISQLLGFSYDKIINALSDEGILRQLEIIRSYRKSISLALEFESGDFINILLSEHRSKNELTRNFVIPCGESTLDSSDYTHIKELDSLLCYLRFAKDSRKKGVNILLYGTPGTGKSEFAKIIAKNISANLFKVRVNDSDGDAQDGEARIGSYLLAQRFLDANKDILLYDEVEDILNCDKGRFKNKAFFNEMLESNPVPTIWITNKIYNVDSALIRRFDFVVAMNAPKKSVHKAMLNKICGEKLDKKTLKLAQKSPNLAPALINRANEVSSVLQGDFSKNFLMLVNNTLKAQGHEPIKKSKKSKDSKIDLPKSYSVDFINADCDISHIADGLSANPNARICLYGLSGTGKSAYAQFIAKTLKRPCIIKAVSDLESMWVGETEKNIARAFKEAQAKKAVLVFDEVDSFLRDRKLARQSWEQTKVNEMLLQMEKFNGIFIATTNLMDNIDKAALRRFDLKVEFRALDCAQRVNLFKKECAILGLKCESSVRDLVARLECLAPGDFAAVKRQHKFSPIKNARDFYARLCDEVKVKDLREGSAFGANGGVGFLR